MSLKRLVLLCPLFLASSVPGTCACDSDQELLGVKGVPCTFPDCADSVGRMGTDSDRYRIYWGDLHGHTANSDGQGSLDHYFSYARDSSKLDFVVVTDHDYGTPAPPWKMPREIWALTNEKADEYTVDGRFVAIAGYEWTTNPNFWTSKDPLFQGPVKYYDHKSVYFPGRVDYLFGAMEPLYRSPDLLAQAVRKAGGLIHNNHLDPLQWPDEFDYTAASASVIVNSEIWPDTVQVAARRFIPNTERTLEQFLGAGGRTGFVGGSDTHEGKPIVKTAVLARDLTRAAIFDALRHRRNYAVSRAPIVLDVRIDGHVMGEAIAIAGAPRIAVEVHGTDTIAEVVIIRDGTVIHAVHPAARTVKFEYVDKGFAGTSYYYVRVIQADMDEYGNYSRAWSSPIWVTALE